MRMPPRKSFGPKELRRLVMASIVSSTYSSIGISLSMTKLNCEVVLRKHSLQYPLDSIPPSRVAIGVLQSKQVSCDVLTAVYSGCIYMSGVILYRFTENRNNGSLGGLKSQTQCVWRCFSKKTSFGVRKSRQSRGRLLMAFSTSRTSKWETSRKSVPLGKY